VEEDLSIYGECLICFGIGRGVLWWDLIFVCASGPGAAAPGSPRKDKDIGGLGVSVGEGLFAV